MTHEHRVHDTKPLVEVATPRDDAEVLALAHILGETFKGPSRQSSTSPPIAA